MTITTTRASAPELYQASGLILLDFDGPITRLLTHPHNLALAARARQAAAVAGIPLDPSLECSSDHLAVLRATAAHGDADAVALVDQVCSDGEVHAARTSPLTPGARDFLSNAWASGRPVVVVTNNNPAAVETFCQLHRLDHLVEAVIGRDPAHIDQLKPHPAMLSRAMGHRRGALPVMIGDSPSDMIAATTLGMRSIGIATGTFTTTDLLDAGGCTALPDMTQLAALTHHS